MTKVIITTAFIAGTLVAANAATVVFQGGDLETAANWLDGVTPGLPGAGDTGTIATSGTLNGNTVNVFGTATIEFSAGTLSRADGSDPMNITTGSWNMSGTAAISNVRYVLANTIDLTMAGDSSITLTTLGANQFGAGSTGSVSITEGASIISNTAIVGSTGSIDIASGWTGSWAHYQANALAYTEAQWQDEFTGGLITLDGNTLDAAGFAANFAVAEGVLTAVPEPSSAALFGLGGIALIMRRRK